MIQPHEQHYQVGNIVRIIQEPPKARRNGFLLGTEHVIQNPPNGYKNSALEVWVFNKVGELKSLAFYEYLFTGKRKRIRNAHNL